MHIGAGDVAISTFQTPYCKHGWNKGEGEGGGKFLKPPPPPPMARLESAKEVKVSRSFGLGTEKCLNYE